MEDNLTTIKKIHALCWDAIDECDPDMFPETLTRLHDIISRWHNETYQTDKKTCSKTH